MYKNLIILSIAALSVASCKKTQQKNSACGTQACTDNFGSVGVQFTDKNNQRIVISNFTALDLRTNKAFVHVSGPTANTLAGYEVVVDDSDLKDLSSDGDNIRVSATNPATGETKTVILKIAGGCNCHVKQLSGPDVIPFD